MAEAALPSLGDSLKFDYWEVQITDNNGIVTSKETYNKNSFAGYTKDVTIYPVYKFEGDVKLIPVDTDSDGVVDYYQVDGYFRLIVSIKIIICFITCSRLIKHTAIIMDIKEYRTIGAG